MGVLLEDARWADMSACVRWGFRSQSVADFHHSIYPSCCSAVHIAAIIGISVSLLYLNPNDQAGMEALIEIADVS